MFIFMELWGFFPVVTAKFVEVGSLPKLTVVWVCFFFFMEAAPVKVSFI